MSDINSNASNENNDDENEGVPVPREFRWDLCHQDITEKLREGYSIMIPTDNQLWCPAGYGAELRDQYGLPPRGESEGFLAHEVGNDQFIFYIFVGQQYNQASYEALRQGVKLAAYDAYRRGVQQIAVPKMGLGLNWEAIQAVLRGSLEDCYPAVSLCLGEPNPSGGGNRQRHRIRRGRLSQRGRRVPY